MGIIADLFSVVPKPGTIKTPYTKEDYVKKALDVIKNSPREQATLVELDEMIVNQQKIYDSLFPIEKEARDLVGKKLAELRQQRINLQHIEATYGQYTSISHEILTWRDYRGYPRLGLFSLHSNMFMISQSYSSYTFHIDPKLPLKLHNLYEDVFSVLEKQASEEGRRYPSISATFSGLIPDSTRQKIVEAKKDFEQIFIIAEVDMKYESQPIPIGDPIVAGWKNNQLWYIDDFDTTAVEEAALLVGPNNK